MAVEGEPGEVEEDMGSESEVSVTPSHAHCGWAGAGPDLALRAL